MMQGSAEGAARAEEGGLGAAHILDALPVEVAVVDPSGYIVAVNAPWRAFAAAAGFPGPGHGLDVGANYLEVCRRAMGSARGTADRVHEGLRAVLEGRSTGFALSYRCPTPLGARWFLMDAKPVAGDHRHAVVCHVDVTAQRMAERALAYRVGVLEAVADVSPVGFLVVGPGGLILAHNRRFEEIWGVSMDDLDVPSDEAALAAVRPLLKDPDAFFEKVAALYAEPERRHSDEVQLADGRVLLRYTSPVRGPDGLLHGRGWFFQDITDVRKAAEVAEAQNRELARLNRELEEFAYTTSHDLSEPLRGIATLTGYALEDPDLQGETREYVRRCHEQALRTKRLVSALLDFARFSARPSKMGVVDVTDVVAEAAETLRSLVDARGAEMRLPDRLPQVIGHAPRLTQVFTNLLANAVKHNDRERPLVVMRAYDAPASPMVEFHVDDNGAGVPPEQRDGVFRIFHRGGEPGHRATGAGVGLAVSRKVIQQHGGDIWIGDAPEGGASFRFTLPRAPETGGRAP